MVVGSLRVGSEDRTRLHVRRDRARADEARRRIPPLGGALGAYLNAFSRTTDLTATFGTPGRDIVRGPESPNVLTGAVGAGRTKRCGYWARFSNAATLSSSRFRASTLFARLRNSPVFC